MNVGRDSKRVGNRLSVLLRRGHRLGCRQFPTVALDPAVFERRALGLASRRIEKQGRVVSGDDEVFRVLTPGCSSPDLYLAVACEENAPGAWEALSREFRPRLAALAVRKGVGAGEADELATETLGGLFLPPPSGGASTGIGLYDGSVRLFSWLAVVLLRRRIDKQRAAAPTIDPVEIRDRARATATGDPVLAASNRETARALDTALERVWVALSAREALALVCKYRDGLPQTAIARILGVGEPRVSRILGGSIAKVRAAVLREVPALEDPGLQAMLRDVIASRLATARASAESHQGRGTR